MIVNFEIFGLLVFAQKLKAIIFGNIMFTIHVGALYFEILIKF